MNKIFTLLFCMFFSANIFAVSVTFNVDMTGQDVSKGVFIVGTVNSWAFTAMTDPDANNIYSVTLELTAGQDYVYYYIRNNSWTDYMTYRETLPAECAGLSNNLRAGGWAGDRYIDVIGSNPIVLNHKFSTCDGVITKAQKLTPGLEVSINPNPASEKIQVKFNNLESSGTIILKNVAGKTLRTQIISKGQYVKDINLNGLAKGVYFVEIKTGLNKSVKKIVVE